VRYISPTAGYSYAEIADHMNISHITIKRHIARALLAIMEHGETERMEPLIARLNKTLRGAFAPKPPMGDRIARSGPQCGPRREAEALDSGRSRHAALLNSPRKLGNGAGPSAFLRSAYAQRFPESPRRHAILCAAIISAGLFPSRPYIGNGPGEQRTVELSDGTQVSLNANSRSSFNMMTACAS